MKSIEVRAAADDHAQSGDPRVVKLVTYPRKQTEHLKTELHHLMSAVATLDNVVALLKADPTQAGEIVGRYAQKLDASLERIAEGVELVARICS